MKERSKKPFTDGNSETMPASLDDEPEEVQGKCSCKPPPKKPEVPPAKVPSACEIVKGILNGQDGKSKIDGCNPKNYNGWNCSPGQFEEGHAGACMPPRRISLCIHNLTKVSGKEKLKEAFIECAAIETFFLWHKYKTDNNGGDAQAKLNTGTIPEDFKRQMFYTFGDYRDLCLDKDIGKDVRDVKNNIKGVLTDSTKNGGTLPTADDWWKTIENDVWKGMLCGLSHASGNISNVETIKNNPKYTYANVKFSGENSPTLEKFAERPQFLRWFTEWAEWYCKIQSEAYEVLVKQCRECKEKGKLCMNGEDMCNTCTKACEEYAKNIKKWEEQWIKIKTKYEKLYEKAKQYSADTSPSEPKDEEDVVSFLSKLHKQNKDNKIYESAAGYIHQEAKYLDCKTQTEFCDKQNGGTDNNKKYALRNEPHDHDDACACKKRKRPSRPAAEQTEIDSRGRNEPGEGQRPLPGPPTPPKPPTSGLGRSLQPIARETDLPDSEEEAEVEEETEEHTEDGKVKETKEDTGQQPQGPPPQDTVE
ncbi:hypothetical protein PFTANZ_06484, partial [Plasmodium falciparum Tanzania (2000708)]